MAKDKLEALVPVKEQPYKVPDNWRWVYVGSVCKFIGGGTPSKNIPEYWDGDIPWASVKDIKGDYLNNTVDHITQEGLENSASNMCDKDDLLLVTRIEPGKTIIAQKKLAINQDLKIVKSDIIPEFLHNYFKCFRQVFDQKASGSTVKGITIPNVSNTALPLPPYSEQKRIVDRIASLFAELDEAKEKAQMVVDGYEDRKEAFLYKAFTGELTEAWRKSNCPPNASDYLNHILDTNQCFSRKEFQFWKNEALPDSWVESKIGNLLYFAGRIGWKGLKAEEYTERGPLLLSVYNLNDGDEVTYNRVYHITEERYQESPEIMVQEGDVLLTKDGAGIGKLGYVKDLPQEATINSSLLLIRPANAAISKYIYYILLGPNLQRIVRERITGSATPHLFQRDIKDFVIPVPSLEEQKEIVRRLDSILLQEERALLMAKNVIRQIEEMKKTILAKAFRGELGTNDPKEEAVSIS